MLKNELDRVSDNNPQILIDYLINASNSTKQHRNRDIWMVRVAQLEEALAALYAHKSRMQLQGDSSPSKGHANVFVQPPEWVLTRARKIGQAPFVAVLNSSSSSTTTVGALSGSASPKDSLINAAIRKRTKDWMLANPQLNAVEEWIVVISLR